MMLSRHRRNVVDLSAVAIGLLIGLILAALLLPLARAEADAGPPVALVDAGVIDPIVAADHAVRPVAVVPDEARPAAKPRPSSWAAFRHRLTLFGENTGGAWLAAIAAIAIRRARVRWPMLRRGWRDEVSGTAFAATTWLAGSLATGATWATAAVGVLMAAAAGTLIAMVPGETQPTAAGEEVPT